MIQPNKGKTRRLWTASLPVLALGMMFAPTAWVASKDPGTTPTGMDKPSPEHSVLASVTPVLLATDVRPDVSVVFQLNTSTGDYHHWVEHPQTGEDVNAYVFDGTTVTTLPRTNVQFNATTGTVTIQHPVLGRYKQYAVVLEIGQKFRGKGPTSTDIVTGVNTSQGTGLTRTAKRILTTLHACRLAMSWMCTRIASGTTFT